MCRLKEIPTKFFWGVEIDKLFLIFPWNERARRGKLIFKKNKINYLMEQQLTFLRTYFRKLAKTNSVAQALSDIRHRKMGVDCAESG